MTFIHQTAINVLEFPYAIKRSELVNSREGQISRFTSDDCCQSQTVQFYFRTRTHGKKMRKRAGEKKPMAKIWLSIVTLFLRLEKMKSWSKMLFNEDSFVFMAGIKCGWVFTTFLWCLVVDVVAFVVFAVDISYSRHIYCTPFTISNWFLFHQHLSAIERYKLLCCNIHYFGNCLISVHIRPQMKPTEIRLKYFCSEKILTTEKGIDAVCVFCLLSVALFRHHHHHRRCSLSSSGSSLQWQLFAPHSIHFNFASNMEMSFLSTGPLSSMHPTELK